MLVENLERTSDGQLPSATIPGLYPIIYITPEQHILCSDCATKALDDPDEYEDWKPKWYHVYLEGYPEVCAECGVVIESAYGHPDDPESL